ncbi:MAG: DUF1850 domain-containing protein [Deltaproteobacteria bacterium]|nr:DUF1850 domain-containing protein [Deltaproteobacteria bacterium]
MVLKRASTTTILILLSFFCFMLCGKELFSVEIGTLVLQIVKQPENTTLVEFNIERGDYFYLDYTHSSDLTPVHDIFQINEQDEIVLLEEDYYWYGAGLEFHPDANAHISYTDKKTKVLLYRVFPHFLLRVGRVAGHVITYKNQRIFLKDIAKGGSSVWIRVIRK